MENHQHIEPSKIRKRIEIEDGLLNTRTTVFLAVSGLLATAVGASSQDARLQRWIAIFGIAFGILWLICSIQSWRVIANLTERLKEEREILKTINKIEDESLIEEEVQALLRRFQSFGVRSTNILALWLPSLFLVGWIALLIWKP